MPSTKKPAHAKWATPPRRVDYTKGFLKDWARLSRSGRYDLERLKAVMLLLIAAEAPLGPEWLDHPLQGAWQGCRECHIGGDFLLIYRLANDLIVFVRTLMPQVNALVERALLNPADVCGCVIVADIEGCSFSSNRRNALEGLGSV